MNFTTAESLVPVENLVNRAGESLKKASPYLARGLLFNWAFGIFAVVSVVKFITDKIEDNKRLSEAKLNLYKEAVKRQNAIIKVLQTQSKLDAERITELTEINAELTKAICEMKEDLDSAA